MQFSHLHNHTQFSLLDGASSIARLYHKATEDNMPAVAITDHGNMFGAFEFVAAAWKNKKIVGKDELGNDIVEPVVKPIVGCEFYLVENRHKRSFSREEKDKRYHQLFLAKNEIGYKNLVKLCSLGFMEGLYGKYPRIDKELVLQYHEGLIATTCCIGASVPKAILNKGEEEAEKEFKWWLDLFGDDYYVELQRHDIPEQIKVNGVLLKWAKKYQVPVIASNDSHYVDQADYNAHDILLCINTGEKKSTPSMKDFVDDDAAQQRNTRFAFYNDQFYFKTTQEMSTLFKDIPQAIENTQLIVDKVTPLKLEREILLPFFQVPENFNNDQDAYLEHLTWEGAKHRYQEITAEIEERIKFELFTVKTMGFAGYFLIVADFIKAGRDLGVFVGPGRGSAAGSAVAYCIGITNIDPIKYKLLFERFLNPDRKSMPDIDTDFDDAGRQKVIDYVVDKYGRNQVAHIVTYGTMAAKMSIKDVARVLDLPLMEANGLAKLVPDKPGVSLKRVLTAPIDGDKGLKEKEGLQQEDIDNVLKLRKYYQEESLAGDVLRQAEILEGSVRGTGIHAAGIIIAPKDLSELLPVATSKEVDLLITQYEGKIIENAGVIKMDFLGLKTLSILKDALELIKLNHGIEINLDTIPLDDDKTFELYKSGATNATFQFESVGMQKHLRDLKPDKFDDLIAMNALYRPGPIQYIPNFIKRKHGLESIVYDLPEMEEYLADTYGITVYQEQVMLLSQKLANFTKGQADVLRKAMGKKDRYTLDKMKDDFMKGATALQHPEDKLNKIWTDWEAFAQYAFNKSHSTCYAFVAYQTAYLKAHYPAEYMAAVLNNNQNNIEKITFFMEECRRMNLPVLGPDVKESRKGFSVNKSGVVRFGLNAIKGVGESAVEDLILERETNGNYASIYDFVSRVNQRTVNKRSLESLVLAGAFDSFTDLHRAQYFYATPSDNISGIERLIRFGNQVQASKSASTNSLFGAMAMPDIKPPEMPACETWSLPELLQKEKEVVGIYLSAHPLDGFKFEMKNFNFNTLDQIENSVDKVLKIAGFVTDAADLTTKTGVKYCRFNLNDYSGNYTFTLWKEQYVKYANYIKDGQSLIITGSYQQHRFRENYYEFSIQNMMLLEQARKVWCKCLNIKLPLHKVSPEFIQTMRKMIIEHPGKCDVLFWVSDETTQEITKLKLGTQKMDITDELLQYMDALSHIEYKLELSS
jgi:DNA polymerase-3 subunit alpha